MKSNVLILGGGGNAGRNVIKCLRRAPEVGLIVALDLNKYYLEASGADVKLVTPPNELEKLATLAEAVEQFDVDWVHPQPDAEVEFLARHAKHFGTEMVGLDHRVLELARDKERCQQLWSEQMDLGFPVNRFVDTSWSTFEALRRVSGKVWVRTRSGAGSRGALPVTRFEEAEAWVKFWVHNRGLAAEDFVLASYLPGPEYAVQMLWWRGELIHCQARERVIHFFATLSPSGQSSTPAVARTVVNSGVVEHAIEAVKMLTPTPHGIFGIDLRCDVRGQPIPTECNYGRFFTTVDFFAELGLNSPADLLRLHRGESVTPVAPLAADHYWVRGLDQNPVLL